LTGQLNGSRPVRLDVVVKSFALSSAVQRILIGGGRGMVADANLVDARTGAVIVAYPELRAATYAGQGIVGTAVQAAIDNASEQSVAEKLAVRYGELYRRWLLHQAWPAHMVGAGDRFSLAIRALPMLETARIGGSTGV
jgi:hypothetical protein